MMALHMLQAQMWVVTLTGGTAVLFIRFFFFDWDVYITLL